MKTERVTSYWRRIVTSVLEIPQILQFLLFLVFFIRSVLTQFFNPYPANVEKMVSS